MTYGETEAEDGIMVRVREMFESFVDTLQEQAIEQSLTADQVLAQFEESGVYEPVVDEAEAYVLAHQADYLTEVGAFHDGFNERLRGYWGDALDGFHVFVDLCIESMNDLHGRGAGEVDLTGEVLLDLHARACLVSHEIFTLLSNGYPFGALASWRTVHELSVIATILQESGRANSSDLTERWLACDDVLRLQDAEIYQERHERLGYEPLSDDDLKTMRDRVADAVTQHGNEIKHRGGYGWAAEICKAEGEGPNFRTLEALAGRDHLRGHYRWSSHRVHGDSRGNENNRITRGGVSVRLAGVINSGLTDAADLTLSSLLIATNCVLSGLRDDGETEPEEVIMMLTLERLRKRTVQQFVDAQARIDAAEAALYADETADSADANPPGGL